jgi:hypothetical protein
MLAPFEAIGYRALANPERGGMASGRVVGSLFDGSPRLKHFAFEYWLECPPLTPESVRHFLTLSRFVLSPWWRRPE